MNTSPQTDTPSYPKERSQSTQSSPWLCVSGSVFGRLQSIWGYWYGSFSHKSSCAFSIHLFFLTSCWFFVNFISCTPNPLISLSLAFATPPTKKKIKMKKQNKTKTPCNGSCSVSVCHTAHLLYKHLSKQMFTAMSYGLVWGLCHSPLSRLHF